MNKGVLSSTHGVPGNYAHVEASDDDKSLGNSEDQLHFAGWWRRAGAYLLRIVIPTSFLSQIIGTLVFHNSAPDGWWGRILLWGSFIVVCVVTNLVASHGITWTDRILHTQVYSLRTGKPAGRLVLLTREFLHILDFACLIGFLLPFITTHKQTVADLIMGTVVLNTQED